MAEQVRKDIRMVGEVSSAGGYYRHVRLTGEATFSGDVDCVKLTQVGELEIGGGLKAGELKITGECDVRGRIDAGAVSGRGNLTTKAGMRADRLKFTGNVETAGDCEAGTFTLEGVFAVSGLLNADSIDIRMFGPCSAREIGGSKVIARKSRTKKLLGLIKADGNCVLNAEQIEGDYVELEHTEAAVVSGNRVEIGQGCRIGRVEYRSELDIHKSAIVNEVVQR